MGMGKWIWRQVDCLPPANESNSCCIDRWAGPSLPASAHDVWGQSCELHGCAGSWSSSAVGVHDARQVIDKAGTTCTSRCTHQHTHALGHTWTQMKSCCAQWAFGTPVCCFAKQPQPPATHSLNVLALVWSAGHRWLADHFNLVNSGVPKLLNMLNFFHSVLGPKPLALSSSLLNKVRGLCAGGHDRLGDTTGWA